MRVRWLLALYVVVCSDSLPQKWRHDWTNYFHHVPHYYVPPMRKGLGKLGGQVRA